MNRILPSLVPWVVTMSLASAQAIVRTATVESLVVTASSSPPQTSQTVSLPRGTVLVDQQVVSAGAVLAFGSVRAVLPATSPRTRFECLASAIASSSASFQGQIVATLAAAVPTAVDLRLTIAGPLFFGATGSIDVGADGTVELRNGPAVATADVAARIDAGALPILFSLFGSALKGSTNLALEVEVRSRLAASVTSGASGCGATIDVEPRDTTTVRVRTTGLPAGGLGWVVAGVAPAAIQLPLGACILGVTPVVWRRLQIDAGGSGAVDFAVPPSLGALLVHVQAVGLDVGGAAITTSDAVAVQLTR